MEQLSNDELEIDLKQIFYVILQKKFIILLVGIVGALVAYLLAEYVIEPVYESSTRIYVMNKQDNTVTTYNDLQTGTQLTKDYMVLVKSRPVTETVIDKLDLDMTSAQLEDIITVSSETDTRILQITVSNKDPLMAKKIADAVRDASGEQIKKVMEIETLNVVEDANLPTNPVSPNVKLYTILGGFLGLLLSMGVFITRYIMDDTIKTPEDIEKYLKISVLGMIPITEESKNANKKEKNSRSDSKKSKK